MGEAALKIENLGQLPDLPKGLSDNQYQPNIGETFESYITKIELSELENMYGDYMNRSPQQYQTMTDIYEISKQESILMAELIRQYLVISVQGEITNEQKGRYEEILLRFNIKTEVKEKIN